MISTLRKLAIGTALVGGLASPLSAQERDSDFEVRTRICEGNPMTIITKEGEPAYRVINAGMNIVEPVIFPYVKDPTIIVMNRLNEVEGVRNQSCRWAEPNEKISWTPVDIPSDSVSVRGKAVYINMNGRSFEYNLPERK